MTIYGKRDDTLEVHHAHLARIIDHQPDIILDNGADLIATAIGRGVEHTIRGATEETTSGHMRLNEDYSGKVPFPVIVINDTPLKQIGENLHAVGESFVESFMRITNLMVNGRRFVVVGYGWCGRGCANISPAFGGRVAVVETDEIKALEAALDGFRVGTLEKLRTWGDVFVTATGRPNVIPYGDIAHMRDGAILVNVGHFPWEIDMPGLRERATRDARHHRLDRTLRSHRWTPRDRSLRRPTRQSRRHQPQRQLDRIDGYRLHAASALARARDRRTV